MKSILNCIFQVEEDPIRILSSENQAGFNFGELGLYVATQS